MNILIIDNYDSFTHNLAQAVGSILAGHESSVAVVRNDAISSYDLECEKYDRIIISPGPGDPRDERSFGTCMRVIRRFGNKIPILGVCLGHQGLAAAYGAAIVRAKRCMHGKTSRIRHDGVGIFRGIPQKTAVMRYHSLVVDENTLSSDFSVTARSEDGEVMAIRHGSLPLQGVQFHPESLFTPDGSRMLRNFLYSQNPDACPPSLKLRRTGYTSLRI